MKRAFLALVAIMLVSITGSVQADSPGPSVNAFRAYPPSCLADPLIALPSGPSWSTPLEAEATIMATGQPTTETVTLTFWRTSCSDGTSALLGLFQRSAQNNGRVDVVPQFPEFLISQGTVQNQLARVAIEPNTVRSGLTIGTPITFSIGFVFENFPTSVFAQFNYSQQLTLTVVSSPALPTAGGVIPAYDPAQYADANLPLPITGYLTGNWYDPAHSGEGIQTEVGEIPNSSGRYITVAWYTFDDQGIPFWLIGIGNFTAGDRSAVVNLSYESNGGFAGNFGASTTQSPWGTVTVDFPNCNTMAFSYQGDAGLPTGVPQGTGSKTWARLTGINGLNCE